MSLLLYSHCLQPPFMYILLEPIYSSLASPGDGRKKEQQPSLGFLWIAIVDFYQCLKLQLPKFDWINQKNYINVIKGN